MSEILMECRAVTKSYGTGYALNNVSMTVKNGRIIGLLGPNGSGKTTLIKLANGLLTPTVGEIVICGHNIGVETKSVVSYLPDCVALPDHMKISELISFYTDFYRDFNVDKAKSMLAKLGLAENMRFKTLSKGNKEKVQLILTMSREARVYLLDEPLGGVDPATRDYILNTIITNYSENSAVVITTHLISDVEKILDEVYFIQNGSIVLNDMVENIRENKGKSVDELFREVFRC